MSFKKLVKRSIKAQAKLNEPEKPSPRQVSVNNGVERQPSKKDFKGSTAYPKSFKERLYANHGDGLARVTSWFPFFAGAWLVSGIVLNNLILVSLIIAPHIAIALFSKLKREAKVPFEREMRLFLLAAVIAINLFIFDLHSSIIIPSLSITSAALYFALENLKQGTVPRSILRAGSQAIFPALLSQLGVMSQTPANDKISFVYMIIGLIPGTVLGAREIILSYPTYKKAGWELNGGEIKKQNVKKNAEENSDMAPSEATKYKPGGYTRLVLAFILAGPVIPSLLLPFRVLPETFLLSSLIFLVFPKLAEIIQYQPQKYPSLCVHLANLSALLAVLMLIAGLLAQIL